MATIDPSLDDPASASARRLSQGVEQDLDALQSLDAAGAFLENGTQRDDREMLQIGIENTEGSAEPRPKKRRTRKPVTCLQCRKRKLKCDRNDPCSACVERNEGDQCSWQDAIRPPPPVPPQSSSREEVAELRGSVDRLQSLVDHLTSRQEANRLQGSVVRSPAALASSQIELADDQNPYAFLPSNWLISFGTFLNDVVFQLPFLHVPSTWMRISRVDAAAVPTQLGSDWSFVSLANAVIAIVRVCTDRNPGGDIDQASEHAQNSVAANTKALRWTGHRGNLDLIRAGLLRFYFFLPREPSWAGLELAAATEMAFQLGLHKDPKTPTLEFDELRQVWHALLIADAMHGSRRRYRISSTHFNTQVPLLAVEQMLPGPRDLAPTNDSRFRFRVQCELSAISRRMTDTLYAVQAKPDLALVDQLQQRLSQLEDDLLSNTPVPGTVGGSGRDAAIAKISASPTGLEYNVYLAHAELRYVMMRLHRPFVVRATSDHRVSALSMAAITSARYIAAIWRSLAHLSKARCDSDLVIMVANALIVLAINLLTPFDEAEYLADESDFGEALMALRSCESILAPLKYLLNNLETMASHASGVAHASCNGKRKRNDSVYTSKQPSFVRTLYLPYSQLLDRFNPGSRNNSNILADCRFPSALPVSLLESPSAGLTVPTNDLDDGLLKLWTNIDTTFAPLLWAVPDLDEWEQVVKLMRDGTAPWANGSAMRWSA